MSTTRPPLTDWALVVSDANSVGHTSAVNGTFETACVTTPTQLSDRTSRRAAGVGHSRPSPPHLGGPR